MHIHKFVCGYMKIRYLILFLLLSGILKGQNLVPNPSFEILGNSFPCSWCTTPFNFSSGIQNWVYATGGTADLFNSTSNTTCYSNPLSTNVDAVGQQLPHSGNGYAGIFTYGLGCSPLVEYREYIQAELITPLIAGNTYYAEMYVSLADNAEIASNNIGMYFSNTLVSQPNQCGHLNFSAQIEESNVINDKTNWTKVSGTFTATSNANYIIIGNFNSDGNTSTSIVAGDFYNSYFLIDDILVKKQCMNITSVTSFCLGDSITLMASTDSTFIGWANSTQANTVISTDTSFTVSPSSSTTYIAYSTCDTQMVTLSPYSASELLFGSDTFLCEGDSLVLNASSPDAMAYLWQDNSTDSFYVVTQAGNYWVDVFFNGCSISDSLNVDYFIPPDNLLGNDTSICFGDSIILDAFVDSATYQWNDNTTNPTLTIWEGGTYFLTISYQNCLFRDSILVDQFYIPNAYLGDDTTLCEGQSLTLEPSLDTDSSMSFLWQDLSRMRSHFVDGEGLYYVTITNQCGFDSDSIEVEYDQIPQINLGNDTSFCPPIEVIYLDATQENIDEYKWNTQSDLPFIEIHEEGLYWLIASNLCGSRSDSILIGENCVCDIFIPNAFTPNGDYLNENFKAIINCQIEDYEMHIFNRWGQEVFWTKLSNHEWDGSFHKRPSPSGVYYYMVSYKYKNEQILRKGDVLLIR